jgi:hypothetical protein
MRARRAPGEGAPGATDFDFGEIEKTPQSQRRGVLIEHRYRRIQKFHKRLPRSWRKVMRHART